MSDKFGFTLLRDVEVPELKTRARLYRHDATGAELLSLENDDENKCFGIAFRTPPADSTGVAHIMEHAVLCGSERFPTKDPFIELAKGSLKTFINAFTYPDKTVYPVASTNTQDLYNLIDVYMDAVLHPLITRHIFEQEAWHYELSDPEAPLSIKGVVYNEMRGNYSSPDMLLERFGQQTLFPDTPYGVDSGGNPDDIPSLTYEQFLAFHRAYYHPSNARIYFYGDDDPEERLRRMAAYLEGYTAREVNSAVPLQPYLGEPRRVEIEYPVSPDESPEHKVQAIVSWLLPEVTDPERTMLLDMLEYILVGTPAAPLHKALIESGLGEDLAGVGLETDLRQMYFSVGLKGINEEDASAVERLIDETLTRLAEEGIDPELIEAALNTTEFSLRENNTGRFPRGLSLMLRSLRGWLYDADPLGPIAFERPLQRIKERLAAGERPFEALIREHLLGNNHRVALLMRARPGLGERQDAQEQERLKAVRAGLREEQVAAIIENTETLHRLQERPDSPEVLARIPSLTLEDLDPKVSTIPLDVQSFGDTRVLYHDLFTNGIVYLDLAMDVHALPQDLLPYLPLFADALTDMGTETEDYVKLAQRIGRKTGGIGYSTLFSTIASDQPSAAWLVVRGKSTMAQADDLLGILRDILRTVRLDNRERFRQILLETKASSEAGLIPGGHLVANMRLRANLSEADWVAEQTGGVSHLFFLRRLTEEVEKDWPAVLERLERVRDALVNRASMVANVTLDAENWAAFRPRLEAFLHEMPVAEAKRHTWTLEPMPENEALTAPTQVNYVAKGANLYDLGYQYHGSVAVISNHLRGTWLWERVRVQGGAYGGFCLFDYRSGVWTFVSYRDPNLKRTIDVYDRTGEFLRGLELPREELVKSIIGTIGTMDAYLLPDAKGYTSMVRYLVGETDEMRQARRDEVLGTTLDDFRRFADVLDLIRERGRVVVLGSPDAVQQANGQVASPLQVTRVL